MSKQRWQTNLPSESNAASRNRTDPKTFPSLLSLTNPEVMEHHDAVYYGIESICCKCFAETGADPDGLPEWCQDPSNELRELYQQLYGQPWQQYVNGIVEPGRVTAADVFQGCIGAAVKLMVYDQRMTFWDSPAEFLESGKE